MNSALTFSNKKIIGVLSKVPKINFCFVPDFVCQNGNFQFYDLKYFQGLIRTLIEDGIPITTTPHAYYAFISEPSPSCIIPFNWNKVLEHTRESIMDHQKAAIETAVHEHNGRSLIAMDMGTGKTLVGCVLGVHYGSKILFIVPACKISDWKSELKQWTGFDATVLSRNKDKLCSEIVITSFDIAKNHLEVLNSKWDCVVVDESHLLKCNSKRSQKIIPMLQTSRALILLSGTPQENRTAELYNNLFALHPRIFRDRREFTSRYSDGHFNKFNQWEETGSKNLEELNVLLSKCMFRVTASVLDLPPLSRFLVYISPSDEQKKRISELKATQQQLAQKEHACTDIKQSILLRMERNQHANLTWTENGRMKGDSIDPWLQEVISKHKGENIVFFTYHVDVAKQLHQKLCSLTNTCLLITNEVTKSKRALLVDDIRVVNSTDSKFAVFTIETCGVGINLCPGVTVMVFLEIHRVPGKMAQAECRSYRNGATKPITSYWIVLDDSTDKDLLKSVQFKEEINSAVIDGNKKKRFTFQV
jgi:SNF2 family DNA or RNA helicase